LKDPEIDALNFSRMSFVKYATRFLRDEKNSLRTIYGLVEDLIHEKKKENENMIIMVGGRGRALSVIFAATCNLEQNIRVFLFPELFRN